MDPIEVDYHLILKRQKRWQNAVKWDAASFRVLEAARQEVYELLVSLDDRATLLWSSQENYDV